MKTLLSTTFYKRALICSVMANLLACSSDNDPEGDFLKFGVISVQDSIQSDSQELLGNFRSISKPVSANTIIQELTIAPDLTEDTCDIATTSADDGEGEISFGGVPLADSMDAGEVITVNSPSGSFADLKPQAFGVLKRILYLSDTVLTSPYPSGLSVDIPGNDFPGFPMVAVPDIEPFSLTSHSSGESVAYDHEFNWVAGNNPEAAIRLYLDIDYSTSDATGADGSSPDTGSNGDNEESRVLRIECVLQDDGSFVFSPAQQNQIASTGLDDLLPFNIYRELNEYQIQGDAFLLVTRSSGNL